MYGLEALVATIGITLVFFLVCRELVCWYFKINIMKEEQQKQTKLLRDILLELNNMRFQAQDNDEK